MKALHGARILVVEDEALIAAMAEDMLADLGAVVIGPAQSVADGLALADRHSLDAALLDVNVRGQSIDPVAVVLRSRKVPILFATGYGASFLPAGSAVIEKPYTQQRLGEALCDLIRAANGTSY